jgi:hypothetical protein
MDGKVMTSAAPLYLPKNIRAEEAERIARLPPIKRSSLPVNGHWDFPEPMFAKGNIGFIYAIRDKTNGMMYLGKKQFIGLAKGNKGIETDWKTYYTSQKDIAARCKELRLAGLSPTLRFDCVCLEKYSIKGAFSFAEVWSLVTAQTPCYPSLFYNKLINGISWNVNELITDRHRQRLYAFLQGEL